MRGGGEVPEISKWAEMSKKKKEKNSDGSFFFPSLRRPLKSGQWSWRLWQPAGSSPCFKSARPPVLVSEYLLWPRRASDYNLPPRPDGFTSALSGLSERSHAHDGNMNFSMQLEKGHCFFKKKKDWSSPVVFWGGGNAAKECGKMIIGALQHSDHVFYSSVFNHDLHFGDTGRLPKLLGLQVNIKRGKAVVCAANRPCWRKFSLQSFIWNVIDTGATSERFKNM